MKNTTTTVQGIEVYENKIWQLVDEYINTVLCIRQEDYDSIEKYKKDIADNRIDILNILSNSSISSLPGFSIRSEI